MRTVNSTSSSSSSESNVTGDANAAPGEAGPRVKRVVSERKRAANRANAQRSTGPKTERGKARSAMNAVRHGLAARASLLPGEDGDELARFAAEMEADLRPCGAAQREVVGRIVSLSWRLRRVAAVEETMWQEDDQERVRRHAAGVEVRTMFSHLPWGAPEEESQEASGEQFVARQFAQRNTSSLERLAVYEQRLDRALHAAFRQLQLLKKSREQNEATDVAEDDEPSAAATAPPRPGVQNEATEPPTPRETRLNVPECDGSGAVAAMQNEPTAAALRPSPQPSPGAAGEGEISSVAIPTG